MHEFNDSVVQVSRDNLDWWTVPGVSAVSENSGQARTQERRDYAGVTALVGRPTNATIQLTMNGFAPGHITYRTLADALTNRQTIYVRYWMAEVMYHPATPNARIAVDQADGRVTQSNDPGHADFGDGTIEPGMAVKTLGQYFEIQRIANGVAFIRTHGVTIGNLSYAVVVPPIRRPAYPCKVTSGGGLTGNVDNFASSSFSLVATGGLPKLEIGSF